MATRYASRMVVPTEFPDVLRDLTREALRALPADVPEEDARQWILEFGANYFEERGEAGKGGEGISDAERASLAAALEQMSPEELVERITAIFLEADRDGNGFLDAREFKDVVKAFTTQLGLPASNVRRIMAEADENEDGCIEYHEFVPLAVDLIQMLIAKAKFDAEKAAREDEAVDLSRQFLLHGMSREELEKVLTEMFVQADADGSGYLSRSEFREALKGSGLGLTRKEINVLLAEVDTDADNRVSYEEFLPLCFNLLVEIVSQEFESASLPSGEAELRDFFSQLFASADPEGTGKLVPHELAQLFRQADLGLSQVQISSLLAEAVVDDDGFVEYGTFAGDAATVVAAIVAVQSTAEKAARLGESRAASEPVVLGMTQDVFEGALAAALSTADADGTGRASLQEAAEVLMSDAVGLGDKETTAVLACSAPDEFMTVDINLVATNAFHVLRQIEENRMITGW